MEDFDLQLTRGFLDEAAEMLADTEQCFLQLELNPENSGMVERIFRLAHSFKGSAGAVGFDDLAKLAHHLENGEIQVSSAIANLLLRANDFLLFMITELRLDLSKKFEISDFIEEIGRIMLGSGGDSSASITDDRGVTVGEVWGEADGLTNGDVSKLTVAGTPIGAPRIQAGEKSIGERSGGDESIRVSLGKIDNLVNDVGELVILQTVLLQHRHLLPSPLVQKTIGLLEKVARRIQDTSMSLRMIPLRASFQKMQRIVRDAAQTLSKQIIFESLGDETEIDKNLLDAISDPLVHLIRNAVDHGIESPEERLRQGKSVHGKVVLRAFHSGENVVIEISDDGRGLNQEKLVNHAIKRGILATEAKLSREEAFQLIFAPGFSTKEQVTALSGRGVGMDVVKTQVERFQGHIEIRSELNRGTTFRLLMPLTLAIIDGLVIENFSERYVIPVASISETLRPREKDISTISGRGEYLLLRGETLPLYRLSSLLMRDGECRSDISGIVIVARSREGRAVAVLVDDIIRQQQVVIKRLGPELHGLGGFSGAAILGDGRAVLIIDVAELISKYVARIAESRLREAA